MRFLARSTASYRVILVLLLATLSLPGSNILRSVQAAHRTATTTLSTSSTDGPASISGLHVVDNYIANGHGHRVTLYGTNRSGLEYQCITRGASSFFDGPHDQASITAMVNWHINAVRIPLNEDCWLGINGTPFFSDVSHYRQAVVDYVNLLNQNGIIANLNMHFGAPGSKIAKDQEPMPDASHAPDFWTSVASIFQRNTSVIFDLFNEPDPFDHDNAKAWTCWQTGGSDTDPASPCYGFTTGYRNPPYPHYRAVGMPSLLQTVRNTGAKNIIVLDGVTYADSLSQWLTYRPHDPQHNLVAGWHPYNFNTCGDSVTCWNHTIAPVLQTVPVIAGEIGEDDCDHSYLDRLMHWLDSRGGSYIAWTWDAWYPKCIPGGGPNATMSVILDYKGTPFPHMGSGYQAHLACRYNGTC